MAISGAEAAHTPAGAHAQPAASARPSAAAGPHARPPQAIEAYRRLQQAQRLVPRAAGPHAGPAGGQRGVARHGSAGPSVRATANHAATPRPGSAGSAAAGRAEAAARPWLGVHFLCGNQYLRVLRHHDQPVYTARCPTCGRLVRFRVGEGGSNARFFQVDCRS